MKTKLHHFAYTVRPHNLELVLDLLEELGCSPAYREGKARWCMIKQEPIPINIQVIETNDKPISTRKKLNTHIAFTSNNPQASIEKVKQWAIEKNIKFKQGSWSDKELWFDLPEVFINFVVEIMHSSIIE